jgi:hypothetical protein
MVSAGSSDPSSASGKARQLAQKHGDAKTFAKALGLYQKPELLNHLKTFLDFLGMDPYEIIISAVDQSRVAYRGVLDRKWLRIQPEILRSLYGTSLEGPVTMVGQVTHVPRVDRAPTPGNAPPPPIRERSELNPSLRDAYQNMFTSGRALEHMFLESENRVEVVVCPLAVYREQKVQISEE